MSHGIDLYKYLLKHKEKISVIEKILKSRGLNKSLSSSYITSQMYINNWKQKDFREFQKKFSDIFAVFKSKNLAKIDITKEKIKVGFLSPDFRQSHSITYFVQNLIKDLKKTKFLTHGLSLLKIDQHDETTEKFKNLFD